MFFSSVIGCSTLTMAWFVQPYFKAISLPLALYGILWTLLNLSVGVTSLFANKVSEWIGAKYIILFILISLSAFYILLGFQQAYWAILFMFLFYLVRGFATPVLKDYINKNTGSNIRATVLSIRSFIIRLLFAAVGPLLGYLNDLYSLKYALILAGTFFFIAGALVLLLNTKNINSL